MKKGFAVASLAVWTLLLLIGLGFAVAGQVNATNRLPSQNHFLRQEVSSLKIEQQKLLDAVDRTRQKELARSLSMANRLILNMPQTDYSTSSGPWPHEE